VSTARGADDRVQLARLLGYVAQDLDSTGYRYAGIVRQCARALLAVPEPSDHGCAACGKELVQPAKGRRRKWCCEACRSRQRRR